MSVFFDLFNKKGSINIEASNILIDTISNGSMPSRTKSLMNKKEPPHKKETISNIKKSFGFIY